MTLRFRDALRMNSLPATEHAGEKLRLARIHAGNREAYQRAKDEVITRILGLTPACETRRLARSRFEPPPCHTPALNSRSRRRRSP